MAVSYEKIGRRFPMDSKMAREISRSPTMLAEQGGHTQFMSAYGGASHFRVTAKMSPVERQVYTAVVVDGLGNTAEISQVTGIKETTVNSTLTTLNEKGLVSISAEPVQI